MSILGYHVAMRTGQVHTDGREIVVIPDPCAPFVGRHLAIRSGRVHTDGREIVEISQCQTEIPAAGQHLVARRSGRVHTDGREIVEVTCRACVCDWTIEVRGNGVLLPGATVTITNGTDTYILVTDGSGVVVFPDLPPGEWTITVAHPRYQGASRVVNRECPSDVEAFDLTVPATGYGFPGPNSGCLGDQPIPLTLYYSDSLVGSVALTYHDTLPPEINYNPIGIGGTLGPTPYAIYISDPVYFNVPYYHIDFGADSAPPCRPGFANLTGFKAKVRIIYSPCIGRIHIYQVDIRRDYIFLGMPTSDFMRVGVMDPETIEVVSCPTNASVGQRVNIDLPCRLGFPPDTPSNNPGRFATCPESELTNLNSVLISYTGGNRGYRWDSVPNLAGLPASLSGTPGSATAQPNLYASCVLPITWTLSE